MIKKRLSKQLLENFQNRIDSLVHAVCGSPIKEQRKNGGKLTNEALTQKGHTPSISIKSKHKKKGKKNGKL